MPILSNQFNCFNTYKVLAVHLPDCPASSHFRKLSHIYATHLVPGGNGSTHAKEKEKCNIVLVRREGLVNKATRGTALDSA
jgi:hypothetical protein